MILLITSFVRVLLWWFSVKQISSFCSELVGVLTSLVWNIMGGTKYSARHFADNIFQMFSFEKCFIFWMKFTVCFYGSSWWRFGVCLYYGLASNFFLLLYASSVPNKTKKIMMTPIIKWKHFPCYWPFVRGTTGHRWIPLTKASDAELWCFLWSASEQTFQQTIGKPLIFRRHRAQYDVTALSQLAGGFWPMLNSGANLGNQYHAWWWLMTHFTNALWADNPNFPWCPVKNSDFLYLKICTWHKHESIKKLVRENLCCDVSY